MAYSGVYVLGDSLVDVGNALKLAEWYDDLPFTSLPDGAPTAEEGYFKGRFSDGYVFTDLISNKFIGLVSKPVFPYGYEDPWLGIPIAPFASDPSGKNLNFAYGGAHIIKGDEAVLELDEQTDALRDAVDGNYPHNGLYLITFGGNDVRDLAPAGDDPVSQAEAYAQLQDVADELLHEIKQMIDDGAQNIVITGIPDCGSIPKYDRDGDGVLNASEQMRADAATEYSIYLDMLIRTQVIPELQQELVERGVDPSKIVYLPVMDYVNASGETVTGALNANLPSLAMLNGLDPDDVAANLLAYQDLVWFDEVHPNAQAHALLASYAISLINGTPWIETMPLLGSDVDYRTVATIGAAGEVDGIVVSMVAGTSYTFQMLGISSVTPFTLDQLNIDSAGSGVVLADPSLRLLSSGGSVLMADDDSGMGLDSSLTFNAATAGLYTLQASAVGALTGTYVLTATVTGAAMTAGNTYSVTSPSTLVIEGIGGIGTDVVKASVSYALAAGSEVEVLRTGADGGKTAINLTGNEFGQRIIGNDGANVIEGREGADILTGNGGSDRFVLSSSALTGPGNIDKIVDYKAMDVVDITQIVNVAAGTNVVSGGYVRVTTSGLVQVDVNGGGNEWITLSTINGTSNVTIRYLSGGVATNVTVGRVSDTLATAAMSSSGVLASAVAAAGLVAQGEESQSQAFPDDHGSIQTRATGSSATATASAFVPDLEDHSTFLQATSDQGAETVRNLGSGRPAGFDSGTADAGPLAAATDPRLSLSEFQQGTEPQVQTGSESMVARGIAMPSAEALASTDVAASSDDGQPKSTGEVERILADALNAGGQEQVIDDLLASLPTKAIHAALESVSDHASGAWSSLAVNFAMNHGISGEMLALHHDAAPVT
ncbi:MAG TPA: SGNH/GDSL hydrolase family protein [Sphingomicrobium sp.]|nr:SGNH/GDSL hydrolase family protein [Sphingomicrobium sp.]